MLTAGSAWGILTDERTPRPHFVADFRLDTLPYGPSRTQPKPQRFPKKECCGRERHARQARGEKIVARRKRLGGIHSAQHERRGKDRPAPFHHLSRKLYREGRARVPADPARRERFARRRIHRHHAWIAAGNCEEPGISDGGADQPDAGEVQTAAAGGRGFRTWHGDAPG